MRFVKNPVTLTYAIRLLRLRALVHVDFSARNRFTPAQKRWITRHYNKLTLAQRRRAVKLIAAKAQARVARKKAAKAAAAKAAREKAAKLVAKCRLVSEVFLKGAVFYKFAYWCPLGFVRDVLQYYAVASSRLKTTRGQNIIVRCIGNVFDREIGDVVDTSTQWYLGALPMDAYKMVATLHRDFLSKQREYNNRFRIKWELPFVLVLLLTRRK